MCEWCVCGVCKCVCVCGVCKCVCECVVCVSVCVSGVCEWCVCVSVCVVYMCCVVCVWSVFLPLPTHTHIMVCIDLWKCLLKKESFEL